MKWIKSIKTTARPWATFLSGFIARTSADPDETAVINDYFVTYLQKMAADRIKPISCDDLSHKACEDPSEGNLNHTDQSLRTLSPLKHIL
jgi:hypothetical protein